jgi:hypothetical protein
VFRQEEAIDDQGAGMRSATASSGEKSIEVRRVVGHAAERVFDAWTDPAALSVFLRPEPDGAAEVELDARVGGRIRVDMILGGKRYEHRGEVLELERPRELAFTWRAEWLPGGSVVTVELVPVDGGTDVVLRHTGLPDDKAAADHTEGWTSILTQMDRHLDRNVGRVTWVDLTVDDAESVRDFYASVVGWRPEPVDMGAYADFNMTGPADGVPRAGVCHARGANAGLPPVWLVYFEVRDLEAALREVRDRGGDVLVGPRSSGQGGFAVIRDPAGAICALASTTRSS